MNLTLELLQDREEYLPEAVDDGFYTLVELEGGIVLEATFLRAYDVRNRNAELRAEYAPCRWVPFLEVLQ